MTARGWDLFEDLHTPQDELLRLNGRGNLRRGQLRNKGIGTAAWDGLLTIRGERHRRETEGAEQVHRSEQRHGPFRRSITLPSRVEAGRIEASAQDGVLYILVPKPKETRAKRISVRPGERRGALTPVQPPGTAANN